MSPHVKDMTDKQRRWWFAHLNEGAENKRRRGNERSADSRRTGEDRWPERTYDEGFMAGWLYVLNRKRGTQHPQGGDDSHSQGFRQGATEANDWLRRMINGCDELCDKIEAVWEALVDYVTLQKRANPTNASDNPITEWMGDDNIVKRGLESKRPVVLASDWWDEIGDIRKWIQEKIENTRKNWRTCEELWAYDKKGNTVHLGWYTDLQPTEIFAVGRGIGTEQEIFDLDRLIKENPKCRKPDLWKKVKGKAKVLDLQTGEEGVAEMHWYQYGTKKDKKMFELKFKQWIHPPGSI